jgi:hypothetical protein
LAGGGYASHENNLRKPFYRWASSCPSVFISAANSAALSFCQCIFPFCWPDSFWRKIRIGGGPVNAVLSNLFRYARPCRRDAADDGRRIGFYGLAAAYYTAMAEYLRRVVGAMIAAESAPA